MVKCKEEIVVEEMAEGCGMKKIGRLLERANREQTASQIIRRKSFIRSETVSGSSVCASRTPAETDTKT